MSKTTNVQFALRRLLAQIREAPELQDVAKSAGVLEKGESVLPKPAITPPASSPARRMSDQIIENGRPGVRAPATPEQLAARLRGADLVEPGELNHLLYADPETHAAINAYQGEMDNSVISGRPVNPAVREQLASVLDKHAQAPQAAPLGFDEGGEVRSSSPGSPGVGGAIKDALAAAKDYFIDRPGREIAAQRQANEEKVITGQFDPIASARERLGYASGGPVDDDESSLSNIAKATDKLGGQKRFTVGVAKQLYGLDENGKPAFGGRAWTKGQGGTPMGILDEITSAPHSLIQLANTVRALDPIRRLSPEYKAYQERIDHGLQSVDPQWSKDASDRLDRLRDAVNASTGIGDPQGIKDHMVDAAASLVTPVPMSKAGEDAGLLKRILEMTTPLRPRTARNFGTDTAVLGGLSTGIDSLTDRLAKLHAQTGVGSGGGSEPPLDPSALPTKDPESFSADMGTIYPEIHRTSSQTLYDEHGRPMGYGIPPESL